MKLFSFFNERGGKKNSVAEEMSFEPMKLKKVGPTSSVVQGPFSEGPSSAQPYNRPTYFSNGNSIKLYANESSVETNAKKSMNENKAAVEFLFSKIFFNLHLSDSFTMKKYFGKKEDYSLEPNHHISEIYYEEFSAKYKEEANEAIAEIIILGLLFGNLDRSAYSHNIKYYADGTFLLYDYVQAERIARNIDYRIVFDLLNNLRLGGHVWQKDKNILSIIISKLETIRQYLRSNEGLEIYKLTTEQVELQHAKLEKIFFPYAQKDIENPAATLYWVILDRVDKALNYVKQYKL